MFVYFTQNLCYKVLQNLQFIIRIYCYRITIKGSITK